MMMKKLQNNDSEYIVDLIAIEGDGSFPVQNAECQSHPKTNLKQTTKS